ncbi:MAG: transposase [Hymenobacter sp.]|nr:transposase [Hymenobacter sp.]
MCRNIRIFRCKIAKDERFRGYNASKKEYFYGYKVYLITAADGRLVEFDFTPGSLSDTVAFQLLAFDLPAGSEVFADKAYNCYPQEAQLEEQAQIHFQPIRKANSKQADNTYLHNWLRQHQRRHIETDISRLLTLIPRRLQAVNQQGFLLKMLGFMLAHNLLFYF